MSNAGAKKIWARFKTRQRKNFRGYYQGKNQKEKTQKRGVD